MKQLEAYSVLLNFTQLGLYVIGLIGVLEVFIYKGETKEANQKEAVFFIVYNSIALVFLSLLPFPLFYSSCFTNCTWDISKLLFACYTLFTGVFSIFRVYKVSPAKTWLLWCCHILPSFLFTALLFFHRSSISIYVSGLIWMFFSSIAQFSVVFIFHKKPENKT
jgi:hypothetical protein